MHFSHPFLGKSGSLQQFSAIINHKWPSKRHHSAVKSSRVRGGAGLIFFFLQLFFMIVWIYSNHTSHFLVEMQPKIKIRIKRKDLIMIMQLFFLKKYYLLLENRTKAFTQTNFWLFIIALRYCSV